MEKREARIKVAPRWREQEWKGEEEKDRREGVRVR